METLKGRHGCNTQATPLHTAQLLPIVSFNRIFVIFYIVAIVALFYHHAQSLYSSKTLVSFFTTLTLMTGDIVLAFMWLTAQACRMNPIKRKEFPENLEKVIKPSEYPGLDVFICTADPTKEPPLCVVNTALSVMTYDFPAEKVSVYVSDDGGSALTLFAFMEAAKFASHWLPFCRENNVMERSPEAYFASEHHLYSSSSCSTPEEIEKIKMMYERMKMKMEHVVERGKVSDEYITCGEEREALNQYVNHKFTRHNHPAIIQVLLESKKDKDINGHIMPNLIYVSREKSTNSHHNFKAGALNVLVRVSAMMTNAPIILTLDCDMKSNDPRTPLRALCYYSSSEVRNKYAYIQFPQHFQGINKNDIYAGCFKRLFLIQAMGYDGVGGANYVGTNCFFSRRAFFGAPSSLVLPEIPELRPDFVVNKPIQSQEILALAYNVAGCNYENQTTWGSKMGFRYGSLVEDLFTGYRLHCEGWRSIFCNPKRAAFLGDAPTSLVDLLTQQKRWAAGVLEIGFSKYSPTIFGIKYLGPLMTLTYSQYAFWSTWSLPITIYAFLPQLALLYKVSLFAKVSEPYFLLYPFLFLGAYGQDLADFVLYGEGTFQMWWSDQRIWTIRGVTCLLFGSIEFILKSLGISTQSFNVTSKVSDDEQAKRYDQGYFDFGVPSPMFLTLSMAALINLASFIWGLSQVFKGTNFDGLLVQMFIAGFGSVLSWPIYQAMVLRKDKGKMPPKITVTAAFLTWALYILASFIFK